MANLKGIPGSLAALGRESGSADEEQPQTFLQETARAQLICLFIL